MIVLLLLATLLAVEIKSNATLSAGSRILRARLVSFVASINDVELKNDSWFYVRSGLEGDDSLVTVNYELCLSSDDICDSYCNTKHVYYSNGYREFYNEEDSSFSQTLRYAVNVLGAFNCSQENVANCTSEVSYANTLLGKNEHELDELEERYWMQLFDYRRDDNLGMTIRRWVLVQTLLAELERRKQLPPTDTEAQFLNYMKAKGAYLGPTVWPARINGGPRGVIVDRNILPGDILYIGKLRLTPSLARQSFARANLQANQQLNDEWNPMFELVAFLTIQAELKNKSALAPYITMLRESVDRGVFGWREDELHDLDDDRFVEGLAKVRDLQLAYYKSWSKALNLTDERWQFDVFQWAFHVVTSRSFDFDEKTLVPFVDMYNHDSERGQQLQFNFRVDDGSTIVSATSPIRRGAEILIKYGNLDFAHLLYAYGFVPKPDKCPKNRDEGTRRSTIDYYKCARSRYMNS